MAHLLSSFQSIARWFGELRSPTLFLILGSLLAIDFFIPDPLPLIDELLLGVLTLLAARRKNRPTETDPNETMFEKPPTKNVTPKAD